MLTSLPLAVQQQTNDRNIVSGSRTLTGVTAPGSSKRYPSDVQQLQEPFPYFPAQFVTMLYNISNNCDFVATFDCLLQGDLQSVLSLIKRNVLKYDPTNSNIPNIHVPAEECDWAIAAFSYYKSCRFNPKSELNIIIVDLPAIDAGEVRRTFFLSCMRKLSLVTWTYLKGHANAYEQRSNYLC